MGCPCLYVMYIFQLTGVACLVKDSNRRSYFIQIFDMDTSQRIWEQELYFELDYKNPKNDFHVFEADESVIALYFAQVEEAAMFLNAVGKTVFK